MGAEEDRTRRWRQRPATSFWIRVFVFIGPVLAAVSATLLASLLLPAPPGGLFTVAWWAVVTMTAAVVLWGTDQAARRLLPLAALLRLALVFPDRAPSRYRVARTAANSRALRRKVEQTRATQEPMHGAEAALALTAALHAHDRRTRGHSERVLVYTELLAEELGVSEAARERLRWGALLHDIGKLSVPATVLNKPARPEQDEWAQLRRHPDQGARLCAPLLPWLGEWGKAVRQHHERYDGSGYPEGLGGAEITLAARIVAVADSYEVMTAPRPYADVRTPSDARAELARCAGSQFDPAVVRAFLNVALDRLRRAMGPALVAAQLPIVGRLANASPGTVTSGKAAAGLAAAVGLAGSVALGPAPGTAMAEADTTPDPGPSAMADTPPSEDAVPADRQASWQEAASGDRQDPPPVAAAPKPQSPANLAPAPQGGGAVAPAPTPAEPPIPPAEPPTPPAEASDDVAEGPLTATPAIPAEPAIPTVSAATPAEPAIPSSNALEVHRGQLAQ